METKPIVYSYPTSKLVAMGLLSILAAITDLVLFLIFICISKPSFKDLSKYDFVVLCITFCLFIVYGICVMMKDKSISTYGIKCLVVAFVVAAAVLTLNIISLVKHHTRFFPSITYSINITVAIIILLVTLDYNINDVSRGKPFF